MTIDVIALRRGDSVRINYGAKHGAVTARFKRLGFIRGEAYADVVREDGVILTICGQACAGNTVGWQRITTAGTPS